MKMGVMYEGVVMRSCSCFCCCGGMVRLCIGVLLS